MEKAKKVIVGFFVVVALIIAGLLITLSMTGRVIDNPISNSTNILFYGESCPHCKVVDEFIAANNISSKLSFEHKEVWNNKDNRNEMIAAAKACNLDLNNLGVPFLYYEGKCYLGDQPIIELLKQEANIK